VTTVIDVARRAGVSITTVSRVLSGHDVVAKSTREKVLQAIEELDFQPNRFAQSLRSGRSHTIAFVVGDIEQSVYPVLSKHLQAAVEEMGHELLLFNLGHSPDRFRGFLNRAKALRLSGILIATSDILDIDVIREFQKAQEPSECPLVILGQNLAWAGISSVWHDDTAGAYAATKHLISIGRRMVGYIGRIQGSQMGQARFEGYRLAMSELTGRVDAARVWDCAYRYPAGYSAMSRAMADGIALDGVIAGSDELALGAMAAAIDNGLAVPDDVSIIGFGNVEWGEHVRPSLSTISNDFARLAQEVKTILSQVHQGQPVVGDVKIERQLILRQSVAPSPRGASTASSNGQSRRKGREGRE
jgi:DNA-binding LacI/PurR family transcriptional regulator